MGNPGQSRGKGWQWASQTRGRPRGLPGVTMGDLSKSVPRWEWERAGIPPNNPSVVTPGECQGTTGCGCFCPFPSPHFLAARAGHRLGHLPFLTARLPMSSLPPKVPGSEALRPSPSVGASQAPLGGRSWEEGMQGWQGLCALLLPSCRDIRHTLASPECTSGPAATLRHRAEHAEALPVNPSLLPSRWAQEAFLHERSTAPPLHSCFHFSFPALVPCKVLLGREDRMVE